MRSHLGEDWPLSQRGTGHPVLEYFTNSAPFTRTHLAQIGHAMDLLSRLAGWPALRARLRHGREGPGALLELELAYPPLARGWEVELGPPTQPGRFCDLRISRGTGRAKRTIYVEASIVDDFSEGARGDMSFQDRLVPYLQLHLAGLDVGGRLHVDPMPDQEDELVAVADSFWKACLEQRKPGELVIPRILELWAVPSGDEEAKQAMIARGYQDGFSGGVLDNPLKRLLRVVRAKLGQLPLDAPGLIVLEPPRMLFRSFPLEAIAESVAHQMSHSNSVVGVGLIQWTVHDRKRLARLRSHPSGILVGTVPDRLIFWKQLGLIRNPSHLDRRSARFVMDML